MTRLHPEVTEEEAHTWLREQILKEEPEVGTDSGLEVSLQSFAEAMAAISSAVLPDELEPLFP